MSGERWEGRDERTCGEHRTLGGRAWCFDCGEYCSDTAPCIRCEEPELRANVRQLEDAVLVLWAEMPVAATRTIADEAPRLADFCRHLHHSIEHEQAMVRRNVWAPDV